MFDVFLLCPNLFGFALSRDWMVKLGKSLVPMVRVVKSSMTLGKALLMNQPSNSLSLGKALSIEERLFLFPKMLISHRIV